MVSDRFTVDIWIPQTTEFFQVNGQQPYEKFSSYFTAKSYTLLEKEVNIPMPEEFEVFKILPFEASTLYIYSEYSGLELVNRIFIQGSNDRMEAYNIYTDTEYELIGILVTITNEKIITGNKQIFDILADIQIRLNNAGFI